MKLLWIWREGRDKTWVEILIRTAPGQHALITVYEDQAFAPRAGTRDQSVPLAGTVCATSRVVDPTALFRAARDLAATEQTADFKQSYGRYASSCRRGWRCDVHR